MDLGIRGKTALVMGASQGLGRAIAEALAAEGVNLVVTARNEAALSELAASMTDMHGITVKVAALDTSDTTAVEAFCDRIKDEFKPDILLGNTGGPPPTPALGADPAAWKKAGQSLLFSMIRIVETAAEGMAARGWGRIVVVGSSGIIQPIANLAMSNTLRGAVSGFCKTLSAELAPKGVTVNLVLPGRIATGRIAELDTARAERSNQSLETVRDQSLAAIPAGRYGDPAEFAAVAVFLMSMQAAYVTGQMTRVDGGQILSV